MTEGTLKKWLQELETRRAQIQLWDKCLEYENCNFDIQQKSKRQLLQIEILTNALNSLDKEERSVIEFHLISKKTWEKTCKIYEDKWGVRNGRSMRTLKRMQSRGLHKMTDFIIKSELEQYFVDRT